MRRVPAPRMLGGMLGGLLGGIARAVACCWVVGGCGAPATPPAAAPPPPLLAVTARSLGPLTSQTPATLGALRTALPGFDIVPVQHDGLEYRVSHAGERLFDVIPDAWGGLLNVHIVSPRIALTGRPWKIGAPFTGSERLTTCECWAAQLVCFQDGDHVAVAFARSCREGRYATAAARRKLEGARIKLAVWSPLPLAPGGVDDRAAATAIEDEGD